MQFRSRQLDSVATRSPVRLCVILVSFVTLAAFQVLRAQPVPVPVPSAPGARVPASQSSADSTAREDAAPDSPRASVEAFLTLARAGQFAQAAVYLDVGDSLRARAPALARELKAVLDGHVWFDLGRISGAPGGDSTDGLPPRVEQVASIPSRDGTMAPVRLTRVGGDTRWRFSRGTVERVDGWYAALPNRWMLDHLPAALLRPGPFDLLWWQWLVVPILIAVSIVLGMMLRRITTAVLAGAVRRTATTWNDAVLDRLAAPLAAAWTLAVIAAAVPWLALYAPAQASGYRLVRAGLLVVFFWALWRLVDVVRDVLSRTHWAAAVPSSRSLLPLSARIGKVVVAAIAIVGVLSLFGYPVASLVAGLGLGGLALALAAQKTVENLFGAFSIGVDQPFREGDFVKIEDFVGTVEAIGLRSTRFRTLDRTIITIPNGRLAEMRLESFTARDRLRFSAVIGLVYETTGPQMREVLAGFERVLRQHPRLWQDAVVVRFREFAASSLDIEVMAWFATADWGEFQVIRQEVLLQFMDVVAAAGTSMAFPTRTIHVASLPAEREA